MVRTAVWLLLLLTLTACAGGSASLPAATDDTRGAPSSLSTNRSSVDGTVGGSSSSRSSAVSAPVTPSPPEELLATVEWVERNQVEAIRVVPGEWLRAHPSGAHVERAWLELVEREPGADQPGMRNQFRCHAHFAGGKEAWFLEPARPDVGYDATVIARCNPGMLEDVG